MNVRTASGQISFDAPAYWPWQRIPKEALKELSKLPRKLITDFFKSPTQIQFLSEVKKTEIGYEYTYIITNKSTDFVGFHWLSTISEYMSEGFNGELKPGERAQTTISTKLLPVATYDISMIYSKGRPRLGVPESLRPIQSYAERMKHLRTLPPDMLRTVILAPAFTPFQ